MQSRSRLHFNNFRHPVLFQRQCHYVISELAEVSVWPIVGQNYEMSEVRLFLTDGKKPTQTPFSRVWNPIATQKTTPPMTQAI